MKIIKSTLFLFFIVLAGAVFSQNSLTGKVTDAKDNKPLEGAIVYIPDLKVGSVVHADGTFEIDRLPRGTYLVQIRYIGYTHDLKSVSIDGKAIQDFAVNPSGIETQEVVITGTSLAKATNENPQPTTEVSNDYINEHSSTNVIDAIALTPGVSAMTDGQSISKPVIRGLGYNRVVTVNDGVIQEDQAWFDEFGIEADPDAVDRYEILKGPASLAYGSDAIAGVVNLIPEAPMPEGEIKADILSNYQTNNGLVNDMFRIAGTNSGISWSGRVDYTLAHSYQNAYDGYALNTQFNNFNTDGTIGIHRKWGYSQVHASYFNMTTGILDGTRDSAGNQLRAVAYPGVDGGNGPGQAFYVLPTIQEEKSYTPFVINQRIRHTKVVWDNSIAVGQGRITAVFSFQRNQRQETNDPTMPNTPDIYYYSQAATYDVRYVSKNYNGFDFSAGVNGAYQTSESRGTLELIPNYNLFQIGGFWIGNYKYKNLTLSGGVRYDMRLFKGGDTWIDSTTQMPVAPNAINAFHEFEGFNSTFNGISGSIGATYNFNHGFYLKANIARGFRAPNVAECAANGVHDGTVVWELGDHDLKPEISLEEDLSVGMSSKDINFELDLFNNSIANFIYAKALLTASGQDSINNTLNQVGLGAAPVYQYTQGPAELYGGEAVIDIHPAVARWIDLYGSLSMVYGGLKNVTDSIKTLPFIPPTRITAELRFNLNKMGSTNKMDKVVKNAYIKVGMLACFQQNQVYQQYSIYNGLSVAETPLQYAASKMATAGYTLLNVGAGGDFVSKGGRVFAKIYISVNNLLNTTYMDYMSRFKYYAANLATGRVGVFDMGRNVSFKVLIPIDIRKGS